MEQILRVESNDALKKNDSLKSPVSGISSQGFCQDFFPDPISYAGMTRGTAAYLSMPEAAREGMYSSIASCLPVQRVGTGENIAEATLMLMTNGFITGVTLDVDGGGVLI